MKKQFKLATATLFFAGAIGLASASPANAAPCPNASASLSTLTPLTFTCDQGGFTFSLTSFSGFIGADAISFSNPTADSFTYSIQSNTPWITGSKTLNYIITAPSGKALQFYTSSLSSSRPNPKAGQFNVAGSVGNSLATLANSSATGGQYDYTTSFPSSETFTATLSNITGNGIQTVQSSVELAAAPAPVPVPGPLPVLGAAAAFGLSRKVRNRIKAAA
jgi:hypothetical protein